MIFTFCAHDIKVTVPVLENRQASSHKQHCYFYTALPPCTWIYWIVHHLNYNTRNSISKQEYSFSSPG